jgi:hypothetical protein
LPTSAPSRARACMSERNTASAIMDSEFRTVEQLFEYQQ